MVPCQPQNRFGGVLPFRLRSPSTWIVWPSAAVSETTGSWWNLSNRESRPPNKKKKPFSSLPNAFSAQETPTTARHLEVISGVSFSRNHAANLDLVSLPY